MSHHPLYDVAVIGGGIVGTSTALSLVQHHSLSVRLLEAEKELAFHQTGHNSGVIHSGLYYKPGSQKAATCTEGRELMYRYCETHDMRRAGLLLAYNLLTRECFAYTIVACDLARRLLPLSQFR